jgi:hypothetical protein
MAENIEMADVETSVIEAFSKVFNRRISSDIKIGDISLNSSDLISREAIDI